MKLKQIKKTFRTLLVFTMASLVATSSLATAFATYGVLVPDFQDQQTVNVEHIWVDKDNSYTSGTVTKEDGTKTDVTTKPDTAPNDTPRPEHVDVDVTATIGGTDQSVKFEEVKSEDSSGTTEPGTSEPGTSEPGTTEPGTTEPGTTEPGTTEPGTTEPGTTEPGTTEPDTTEPGTTEPSTTDKIVDNGSTAGKEAGEKAGAIAKAEDRSPVLPGHDDGFNEAYKQAYVDAINKTRPADQQLKVEDFQWQTPKSETSSGESENPPAESGKFEGPLDVLDSTVAGAIKDILDTETKGEVVKDLNGLKDQVGTVTDKLLEEEKNQGNVWHESKDYVAKVEVKEDGSKPPVTYQVELTDETKEVLENAGYESVQLKVTVETVFAVMDDNKSKYIDPYSGKEVDTAVLAVCKHVSYDNGKTWEIVGEPEFRLRGEDGKPGDIYKYTPDGETTAIEMEWGYYCDKLTKADGTTLKTDAEKQTDVKYITQYDSSRDYVSETTYTFMHVLNPIEVPPTPPEDPKTPEDPKDPETPDEPETPDVPETPEENVPDQDVPLAPPEENEEEEVPDTDVPLATVPETGDYSGVWTTLAMLAVAGLLGVTLLERKKAENS